MKKRFLTGTILFLLLALFVGLREINTYFFDFFILIVLVCASCEVSRVFIRSSHHNNMTIVTMYPFFYYLGFMFVMYQKLNFWYFLLVELAIFVFFAILTIVWTALDKKSALAEQGDKSFGKYFKEKVLLTLFLLIYPTMLIGLMFIFNHIADLAWFSSDISANLGLPVICIFFAISIFTDTFAYLVGSLIKGPKLCPFISPNKTISGAIGGLIGGVAASLIAFAILSNIPVFNQFFVSNNIFMWQFLIYGIVGSVFTQVGDIFASWLKRKALTKDFSSIFPGHGGFMDRFDGLSFNAVSTLIFILILFI